jgi:hypothetical protein
VFGFDFSKGAKKVEVKYITAQERKDQAGAAGSSSSVIFDMRGPNARILQTEQVRQRGLYLFAADSGFCLTVSQREQLRSDAYSLNDGPFPELEHNM